MLEGLDDIRWETLTHAYGPAADVPVLLRQLLDDDAQLRESALWELYGNVFHQGTRYEASRYAVPFLVELATDVTVPDRHLVVYLLVDLAVGYQEHWLRTGFQSAAVRRRQEAVAEAENKWEVDEINVYDAVRSHAPSLIHLAEADPDPEVRRAASYALAFIPDEMDASVPVIRRRIDDDHDSPVSLAHNLLAYGLLGGPVDEGVRERLVHRDELVRFAAACAIARVSALAQRTDTAAIGAVLDALEHEDVLAESGLHWNDSDLVGLGWITLEVSVPEFDLPLLGRICDSLASTSGPEAQTLAGVVLSKLFSDGSDAVPQRASDLSSTQRPFLETLATHPQVWTWGGTTLANFSLMMTDFGLPGDAEATGQYLAGEPLENCLPAGLRRTASAPEPKLSKRRPWHRSQRQK